MRAPYDQNHNSKLAQWLSSFPRPSSLSMVAAKKQLTIMPEDQACLNKVYRWLIRMLFICEIQEDEFDSTAQLFDYLKAVLPHDIVEHEDFEDRIMCALNNHAFAQTCPRHTRFWFDVLCDTSPSDAQTIHSLIQTHMTTILDDLVPHRHVHSQFDIEGDLTEDDPPIGIDLLIDGTMVISVFQEEKSLMHLFKEGLVRYFLLMDYNLYEPVNTLKIHHGLYMQTITVDLAAYFQNRDMDPQTLKDTFNSLTQK